MKDSTQALIEAAGAAKRAIARQAGVTEEDWIVVEYRGGTQQDFEPTLACVSDGRITVGHCVPSPRMVGRVLSRPISFGCIHYAQHFSAGGVEYDILAMQEVADLADGKRLYRINHDGSLYWIDPQKAGNDKRVNLIEMAITRSPA